MLEQFRIKLEDAVMVQGDDLRGTVVSCFEKVGVPSDDAALAADVLVQADLRGVDTHGVSNTLRSYLTGYQNGTINPRPDWKIVRETPATANIDSDRGLGVIVTPKAMRIAIAKAKEVGIGMVTLGNARHLGMASYHAMLALEHDMIGVCMTSCPPSVLPTFGAEPRLGTNPIALAAPARHEPPFVFDAATSSVAANKLGIARRLGAALAASVKEIDAALAGEDFARAMAAMAALRQPVDQFFDRVTVNTDNGALRANRLRLLSQIRATLHKAADFGEIEG